MVLKNFHKLKTKLIGTAAGISAAATNAVLQVYCGGLPIDVQPVTVNTNIDGKVLVSRIVGLICGAIALVGILSFVNGYSDYAAAKKDDNATAMSKASNKMMISVLEMAAPAVVGFIFAG